VYRTNVIAWELLVGYGQLVTTFIHMMMTRLTQSANNPPLAGPAGTEPRCPPTMKRCQAILMLNPDLLTFIMEIMLRTTRLTSTDSVVENWQCVHQWFTVCTRVRTSALSYFIQMFVFCVATTDKLEYYQ
jgi:hypothetical protein